MEGFVKLYRQLMISPVFENEKLLKVWIWCLLKATHTELKTLDGLSEVVMEPGQFGTGLLKAAAELNMSKSTVDRYLKALEKNGMISRKVGNKKTFITVENWSVYQCKDNEVGKEVGNEWETNGKEVGTYKNVKNVKNDKNIIYNPPVIPPTGNEFCGDDGGEVRRFCPPTVEEVRVYCQQRGNGIDAVKFVSFYESKGWMIGKNKMKSWKQAVITWERQQKGEGSGQNQGNTETTYKLDKVKRF